MKKILVFISMFLLTVSVSASMNSNATIELNEVKISLEESVGYNDKVKVSYEINPKDATNKKLTWEISSVEGVTATLEEETTSNVSGSIYLTVLNNNEESSVITLVAKQNGETISSKEITVEAKEETINRVVAEVTELIEGLDTDINNDNYEDIKEIISTIEEKIKDEEIKSQISEELLAKYNSVKEISDEYTPSNNTLITIITIALVIIFTGLLFWIFNKED